MRDQSYLLSEEDIKSLKDYYSNCKLFLPENPNWRVWKIRVDNGTKKGKIIKIKDNIRDEKTLRKWLLRIVPIDVYYSSGCFINPTSVKGAKSSSHLLFRDIPFDLDAEKPYGVNELDVVRKSTIKLIQSIRKKLKKDPMHILYTGGRGFQVIYNFKEDYDLTEFLEIRGVDKEITTDKFRVIRCPLTVNKRGKVAIFLTEKDLNKGMSYILNKSKTIHSPLDLADRAGRRDKMLGKSNTSMTSTPSQKSMRGSSATAPTEPPLTNRAIYITNEVNGTKRYIPILKYNYREINPKTELQKLSDEYGLNEWFLIKTNGNVICVSLAALDKRRLSKILNSTNSITKGEFGKLSKIFMRVSPYEGGEDKPTPLGIVYLKTNKPKEFLYSRPHADMLGHFNFSSNPFMKYIGYEKPKILEVSKR